MVIEQQLRDLTQEFDLSVTDSEILRRQLLQMQHRTYLWLYLAMQEVREICRDSIYGEELRIVSLPTSVEDAYERILCNIKDRQKTLALRILLSTRRRSTRIVLQSLKSTLLRVIVINVIQREMWRYSTTSKEYAFTDLPATNGQFLLGA